MAAKIFRVRILVDIDVTARTEEEAEKKAGAMMRERGLPRHQITKVQRRISDEEARNVWSKPDA